MSGVLELDLYAEHHDIDVVMDRLVGMLGDVRLTEFLEEETVPYLMTRMRRRFEDEGDDVVGEWEPLRDSTVAIREAKGFSAGPINQRTGEMIEFLTNNHSTFAAGGAVGVAIPGGNPAGEMLDKIRTAQGGKKSPSTKPRPVLGMNTTDVEAILAGMRAWVVESIAT